MFDHFENSDNLSELKVEFAKPDLDAALTFAQIARQSSRREKALRDQKNARKAYDILFRYLAAASLSRFVAPRLSRPESKALRRLFST
jgi:hypothetical protein